jgi:Rrf2 family protein
MFTRSAEYAIRAMTFLALQPAGKLSGAREIAQQEQIPMPFLWKILHNLTRKRLIRSFRGVRGGYELARPAGQISIEDILFATHGAEFVDRCVLGLHECSEQKPCPLHPVWKEIKQKMVHMLEQNTLADLARVLAEREPLHKEVLLAE